MTLMSCWEWDDGEWRETGDAVQFGYVTGIFPEQASAILDGHAGWYLRCALLNGTSQNLCIGAPDRDALLNFVGTLLHLAGIKHFPTVDTVIRDAPARPERPGAN